MVKVLSAGTQFTKTDRSLYKMGADFFAVALAIEIIWGQPLSSLLLLPGSCWIGATLHLLPEETS